MDWFLWSTFLLYLSTERALYEIPHLSFKLVMAHQPAIIIVDNKQKKDTVIDIAIPSDSNIRQKEHLKYINLKIL